MTSKPSPTRSPDPTTDAPLSIPTPANPKTQAEREGAGTEGRAEYYSEHPPTTATSGFPPTGSTGTAEAPPKRIPTPKKQKSVAKKQQPEKKRPDRKKSRR